MRKTIELLSLLLIFATLFHACCCLDCCPEEVGPNTLTQAEQDQGWTLLFDGKTTQGWRAYKGEAFPAQGWTVEDGALKVLANGGGGDIISDGQYGSFDLRLEFKVAPKANSGIIYRVSETADYTWQTGAEFQILDDQGHGLVPSDPHSSGAMYDLYTPPAEKPVKPAGEWNSVRIKIDGNRVEHWFNGVQVVECDLASEDWETRRSKSKFHVYEGFGRNASGHIALQDHGNDVWFRNIKVLAH